MPTKLHPCCQIKTTLFGTKIAPLSVLLLLLLLSKQQQNWHLMPSYWFLLQHLSALWTLYCFLLTQTYVTQNQMQLPLVRTAQPWLPDPAIHRPILYSSPCSHISSTNSGWCQEKRPTVFFNWFWWGFGFCHLCKGEFLYPSTDILQ